MTRGGQHLLELFDGLIPPANGGDAQIYSAIPIPDFPGYRVAKDGLGAPALLARMETRELRGSVVPPIRLQHLYVAHNVECDIHRPDGEVESGQFLVVRCTEADSALISHFMAVIEALIPSLGQTPTPVAVNKLVDQLAELFRAMKEPPRKTVQGLWAELLVIRECSDPTTLIDAWHVGPEDLYDFSADVQRIEVKSAVGQIRAHYFSLAQLHPPSGTQLLVASVLVNRIARGCTIADLVEGISTRIGGDPERVIRLHRLIAATLGTNWRQASMEAFDLDQARTSLHFFQPSEIPSVAPIVPDGVSDVSFRSDLSGLAPATHRELSRHGGIISTLRGSRLE